ncbi:MAG TPA: VTC domain-containing protein, partial [Marinobacter adhaerens]|nr:VTC domain-containing protein [Marinobacter adhaerens]
KIPRSPLLERLGQLGCRPVQFSKYCIGTSLLFGHECKTNRFKPLLRRLHGIGS